MASLCRTTWGLDITWTGLLCKGYGPRFLTYYLGKLILTCWAYLKNPGCCKKASIQVIFPWEKGTPLLSCSIWLSGLYPTKLQLFVVSRPSSISDRAYGWSQDPLKTSNYVTVLFNNENFTAYKSFRRHTLFLREITRVWWNTRWRTTVTNDDLESKASVYLSPRRKRYVEDLSQTEGHTRRSLHASTCSSYDFPVQNW